MSWTIKSFEENGSLIEELVPKISTALVAAIKKNDCASLVVSGGRTPQKLFSALSECSLPWEKVTVTLVDERWLPEDHPDSNAGLVKRYLLQNNASAAKFIGLTGDYFEGDQKDNTVKKSDEKFEDKIEKSIEKKVEEKIEKNIAAIQRPFTVVILGMGDDGHTASFFPGAATLERAMYPTSNELCVAVTPPSAPHDRMTLTLPTLLDCEHLILHIVGTSKWQRLQAAIQPGAALEQPIRAVLYQYKKILEIFYAAR